MRSNNFLNYDDLILAGVTSQKAPNRLAMDVLFDVQEKLSSSTKLSHYIPSTPTQLVDVLKILRSSETKLVDLINIVIAKPILSAEIIKMANSAIRGKGSKAIESLRQAVLLLGLSKSFRLTLRFLIAELITANFDAKDAFINNVWQHSLHCATFNQLLAPHFYQDELDGYFIGLVHDLGKVVIYSCMVNAFKQLGPGSLPDLKMYKVLFKEFANEVALFIAWQWQLPEDYCEALAQQSITKRNLLAEMLYSADKASETYLLWLKGEMSQTQQQQLCNGYGIDEKIWLKFQILVPKLYYPLRKSV